MLGLKGAWCLTYLLLVCVLFAARVWINRHGWFGRHTISPPELRRREGMVLRDKLVALGPTFITRLLAGEAGSVDWEGLVKLAALAVTYIISRAPLR